jgi:hypothetical protein
MNLVAGGFELCGSQCGDNPPPPETDYYSGWASGDSNNSGDSWDGNYGSE